MPKLHCIRVTVPCQHTLAGGLLCEADTLMEVEYWPGYPQTRSEPEEAAAFEVLRLEENDGCLTHGPLAIQEHKLMEDWAIGTARDEQWARLEAGQVDRAYEQYRNRER